MFLHWCMLFPLHKSKDFLNVHPDCLYWFIWYKRKNILASQIQPQLLLQNYSFIDQWMLLLFGHPVMSNSCDPMNCSTTGLPVPHHLLEFAQVHAYCINDAIQPSHPLMPSSPPALNLSQHLGQLFELGDQSIGASDSASVLPVNIHCWFL